MEKQKIKIINKLAGYLKRCPVIYKKKIWEEKYSVFFIKYIIQLAR